MRTETAHAEAHEGPCRKANAAAHAIVIAALLATAAIACNARAEVRYVEVPVVDVEPVIETVRRVTPEEHCSTQLRERRASDAPRSASAGVIGAVVGGAIGNAVGHKKRNKQVGTVVGAVLGGVIASDMARQAHYNAAQDTRLVREEVCEVVRRVQTREEVAGYLVTYRYADATYRTRMDREPGERIRLRVAVAPVGS